MRLLGKLLTFTVFGAYALCGLALLLFLVPVFGLRALHVATGSMRPAVSPGSLVVIASVPPTSLQVGDIITYRNPANAQQTITHRIIRREVRQQIPFLTTKGDANPAPDPEIVGGLVVGKVLFHLPYLGAFANWVKTPLGLITIIFIPALFIMVDESRRLYRALLPELPPAPRPQPAPVPLAPVRRPVRRGLDGMTSRRLLVLAGLVSLLGVGTTKAVFTTNKVSLTGTTLNIQVPGSGAGSGSGCPGTITQTGQGSVNVITCHTSTTTTTANSTTVTVTGTTNQTTTTGGPAGIGNTTTSSTSGSAANSSQQSADVKVSNY